MLLVAEWPAWAVERVDVHPPDPAWQQRGEQAARLLDAVLSAWLVAPVEHVGSTAVPGLAAKPVLDLQGAVADLDCASRVAAVLAPLRWHYVAPELDERAWRRLFVQVADERRTAHLHLVAAGSARWSEQLAFRDALRADPALRDRYATLKRELAHEHPHDREAYTAGKANFVHAVLAQPGHRPLS